MSDNIPAISRFSDKEDQANAISHFAGALLSVAALVVMTVYSVIRGNAIHIISSAVFGFSMIFLYSSSAIAHWLPAGKKKDAFFTLDQVAIFILIAGTYTPLSLVALKGITGVIILTLEWGLAATGIIRLLNRSKGFDSGVGLIDILIYIIMGWLVVVVSGSVLKSVPVAGYIWIITGGVFYTVGVIFFKIARFRFHHLVWHLLVIGGTASHFVAIFLYILP
jgi:hemolysin III